MKTKELIEKLLQLNPETPVDFTCEVRPRNSEGMSLRVFGGFTEIQNDRGRATIMIKYFCDNFRLEGYKLSKIKEEENK